MKHEHPGHERTDIYIILACSILAFITIILWHFQLLIPGIIVFIAFLIVWPLDEARGSNYAGWIFIISGILEIYIFGSVLLGFGFIFLGILSLYFP